jgi:hypothetical protein
MDLVLARSHAPAPRQRLDSKVSAFLVYRAVAAPPKALLRSKGAEMIPLMSPITTRHFSADAAARYFSRLLAVEFRSASTPSRSVTQRPVVTRAIEC